MKKLMKNEENKFDTVEAYKMLSCHCETGCSCLCAIGTAKESVYSSHQVNPKYFSVNA